MSIKYRFLQFRELVFRNYKDIIYHTQQSWHVVNFNQPEPNIIFDYLQEGVIYLNQNVSPILSTRGFIIKFAGVFIHQKPIVTPISYKNISNGNCEVGDLLTLFLMLDRNKKVLYQSAFISQAKKENRLDNRCQRFLYEESYEFEYLKGGCTHNGSRRILPKIQHRHLGMNYLILDESYSFTNPFIKLIPFNNSIKFLWGETIFLMLSKLYGLMFRKTEPTNGKGWSRIIWDLINCTGRAAFRGQSRGSFLRNFLNRFNQDDEYFFQSESPEGGTSILFIIAQDEEVK